MSASLDLINLYVLNIHQGCAKAFSSVILSDYHINPSGKCSCLHHLTDTEAKALEIVSNLPNMTKVNKVK